MRESKCNLKILHEILPEVKSCLKTCEYLTKEKREERKKSQFLSILISAMASIRYQQRNSKGRYRMKRQGTNVQRFKFRINESSN